MIGLHPHASQPARRFPAPMLVFNLHDQFEHLREAGKYGRMRERIFEHDAHLAKEPNPMLSRFGGTSEARQYSGRQVSPAGAARSGTRAGERYGRDPVAFGYHPPLWLRAGERLTVIDPEGQQVSDLVAFRDCDPREVLSNGRSFDYEQTLRLTAGNRIWSNLSHLLLEIEADTVGCHDFLLTPFSEATFGHFNSNQPVHRGCMGNLVEALAPFRIDEHQIPTVFNVFMNVPVDGEGGKLRLLPPFSKAGRITFRALTDLVTWLVACSAYGSNGGSFK